MLGHFGMAAIVLFVFASITVNVFGFMGWFNISFNAISLVNIVISSGISVEFCSNIARAYLVAYGTRSQRVSTCIADTGVAVFSGITLTKFFGVFVLAFAKSGIFEVFYFRIYLAILLFGAVHGLLIMPVFLTMFGPSFSLTIKLADGLDADINHTHSEVQLIKPI